MDWEERLKVFIGHVGQQQVTLAEQAAMISSVTKLLCI